jgi:putative heme-binding domain-containing protein
MTSNKKTLILLGAALLAAGGAAAGTREAREELRAYAQAHDGPVERGRQVYLGLGCASCHGAAGAGTRRGPDLRGISTRYDRAEIIRSVLEPSARFAPGWQTVTITTTDGRVVEGRLQNDPAEGRLVILDRRGRRVEIPKERIERYVLSRVSGMPEGLCDDVSKEDFAALVSYLRGLK